MRRDVVKDGTRTNVACYVIICSSLGPELVWTPFSDFKESSEIHESFLSSHRPASSYRYTTRSVPITQVLRRHQSRGMNRKRKADSSSDLARKSVKVDDYCNVQLSRDSNGNPIWPAPEIQIDAAREFLKEW